MSTRFRVTLTLLATITLASTAQAMTLAEKQAKLFSTAPQKILFGSCMHQDKDMPIFSAINRENPDLFIFLGDNIYGDTRDMQKMAAEYQRLGQQPGLKQLRAGTPTIAIWDDHDFGENDAGADYPQKQQSRKLMLDFWQEDKNSLRYSQQHGIYTSYRYGSGDHTLHVIMPDLRWNRTPLAHVSKAQYEQQRKPKNMGPYSPDNTAQASMLGERQWQWLEQELLEPAAITIIASSLQLLPEFTGWESWANFPNDRNRLLAYIKQHQLNGVMIISGDTHWGEISAVQQDLDYPLYEVTSSGLTQEWKYVSPNRHRISKAISTVNYGEIAIDWQQQDPSISLNIKDIDGNVFASQQTRLSKLSPYPAHDGQETLSAANEH